MRIAIFLLATLAIGAQAQEKKPLVWRGCEVAKGAFMQPCAEAYQAKTGIPVRLAGGGAALGIAAVDARAADLGGSCRDCRSDEQNLAVRLTIVAWDAVVAIANPSNPVDGLTTAQLKAIFRQQTTSWKDVGGAQAKIVVVVRKEGARSGVGLMSRRLIFGDDAAAFGARVLRLPRASGGVEALVARQARAIAFTGASSARHRKLKLLAIDGISPTAENIASGKYPYYRPLYLALHRDASPRARAFRDWLVGADGQAVIGRRGTVTLEKGLQLVRRFKHFKARGIDNLEALRERSGK